MTITVGSLCTGIGGLEMALEMAGVDHEVRWQAETDPNPSRVLAHRFPGVPNLGDWTTADLPPVDLLIGGLPCQPVSQAGRRRGTKDERWLFDDLFRSDLLRDVRPALVLENVRGIMSQAGGETFRQVLGGLADLGYVGRYGIMRACAVGAPHRRERWFCFATHPENDRLQWSGPSRDRGAGLTHHDSSAAHPDGTGPQGRRGSLTGEDPHQASTPESDLQHPFGPFQPAIDRWASIIGRPPPDPQDERQRLSPALSEWMMGYPDGYVTDPTLGLSRAAQLKALGNAVVPRQAAMAWQLLTTEGT